MNPSSKIQTDISAASGRVRCWWPAAVAVAVFAALTVLGVSAVDISDKLGPVVSCGVDCDQAFTIYVGGDLELQPEGAIEGRAAVSGSLRLSGAGAFTSTVGGVGEPTTGLNRTAPNLGENLIVSGNVEIAAGHVLRIDGIVPVSGTVVVGGVVTGTLLADNAEAAGGQSVDEPFDTVFEALGGASQCWKSLPSNGALVPNGADWLLTGDGVSALQVFSTTMPSSGAIDFANIPMTATIVVNVFGDVDYSGPGISSTAYVSMTVFNFYDAVNVVFSNSDPASSWRSSIALPTVGAAMTTSMPLEGRIAVRGDLVQGRSGVEFRSQPFAGQTPNCDWGDLPDTGIGVGPDNYVTLSHGPGVSTLIGPSHLMVSNVYLGSCVDGEPNGQPSNGPPYEYALKDDKFGPHGISPQYPGTLGTCGTSGGINTNDEDGVSEGPGPGGGAWQNGVGGGSIDVVGTLDACFNGWIDWNNNGLFTDLDEQVATNVKTTGVTQNITFTIPAGTLTAGTQYFFSRYRITARCDDYANDVAAPTDVAYNGEVEDYRHTVQHATAATLTAADIAVHGNAARLTWSTGSEVDILGFNVLRAATADGAPMQANASIIAAHAAGSPDGATYTWSDPVPLAAGATRFYWLEIVGLEGSTLRHGPLVATNAAAQHSLFLPGVFGP